MGYGTQILFEESRRLLDARQSAPTKAESFDGIPLGIG
jgi:hypothetical protein